MLSRPVRCDLAYEIPEANITGRPAACLGFKPPPPSFEVREAKSCVTRCGTHRYNTLKNVGTHREQVPGKPIYSMWRTG
jgi:hypothetical protein